MALQIQGNGGTIAEVSSNYRAMYTTLKPEDVGSLGCYSLSMTTGVVGAGLAANSEVFQFRWTDATRLAVITKITFDGAGGIAAFTAGAYRFEAIIARSFSASGSGGTAATITGNNNKRRTSFGTTLLGEARCASTAALGAGTKTLDTQGIGAAAGGLTATAGDKMSPGVIYDSGGVLYGITLVQNEGFAIRATVPATGTWTGAFSVHWCEMSSYPT